MGSMACPLCAYFNQRRTWRIKGIQWILIDSMPNQTVPGQITLFLWGKIIFIPTCFQYWMLQQKLYILHLQIQIFIVEQVVQFYGVGVVLNGQHNLADFKCWHVLQCRTGESTYSSIILVRSKMLYKFCLKVLFTSFLQNGLAWSRAWFNQDLYRKF